MAARRCYRPITIGRLEAMCAVLGQYRESGTLLRIISVESVNVQIHPPGRSTRKLSLKCVGIGPRNSVWGFEPCMLFSDHHTENAGSH
jgi:hypothetical protein